MAGAILSRKTRSLREQLEIATSEYGPTLDLKEAASIARRSVRQIRRWIDSQKLRAMQAGSGKHIVLKCDLLDLLAGVK